MKIGDKLYLAKRIKDDNPLVENYTTPTAYTLHFNYLTVQKASNRGFLEVLKYGEKSSDTWTVIANARFFDGVFEEGDLVWVDGDKPIQAIEEEYGAGSSATATVTNVSPVNLTISIVLQTNQKRIKR